MILDSHDPLIFFFFESEEKENIFWIFSFRFFLFSFLEIEIKGLTVNLGNLNSNWSGFSTEDIIKEYSYIE